MGAMGLVRRTFNMADTEPNLLPELTRGVFDQGVRDFIGQKYAEYLHDYRPTEAARQAHMATDAAFGEGTWRRLSKRRRQTTGD